MTITPRDRAEQRARQLHDARCRQLEGHKIMPWESLSEMMREALIATELKKLADSTKPD
jgi:hypothetical protein